MDDSPREGVDLPVRYRVVELRSGKAVALTEGATGASEGLSRTRLVWMSLD